MAAGESVVFTSRALVSPFGNDVLSACAAARAGLVRTSEVAYRIAAGDGEDRLLLAHAVKDVTRGFDGEARLARLLTAGFDALHKETRSSPPPADAIRLYLAIPDPQRRATTLALVPDEQHRAYLEASLADAEKRPISAKAVAGFVARAAARSAWTGPVALAGVFTSGHGAVAEAIEQAAADLLDKHVGVAIVAGIDTLLTGGALAWLDATGRLKSPDAPTGLLPGEAAAFLVLDLEGDARQRGARVLGRFVGHARAEDPEPHARAGTPGGRGICAALSNLESAAGWSGSETRPPLFVVDLNGENYRATDWGNALVRLASRNPAYREVETWIPALSFGDTGAASGAVGLCVALHAFHRGYTPHENIAVVSCSDGAHRAAVLVARPPHGD